MLIMIQERKIGMTKTYIILYILLKLLKSYA